MSEQMKKQIQSLCAEANKLNDQQQAALSLIAQGMALQAELDAEKEKAAE